MRRRTFHITDLRNLATNADGIVSAFVPLGTTIVGYAGDTRETVYRWTQVLWNPLRPMDVILLRRTWTSTGKEL